MRRVFYAIIILVAAMLVIGTFMATRKTPPPTAPASTEIASPEAIEKGPLPKILTLYQKGEGESELAAFVARELSRELKGVAVSKAINVLAEPQMAEFFGVSITPAVIFLSSSGKVLYKHEGYLDKAEIISRIKSLNKS